MSTITQQDFDGTLANFAKCNFNNYIVYRFIPCIEYSKEMWPADQYYQNGYNYYTQASCSNGRYYLSSRQSNGYGSYNNYSYVNPDPIANIIGTPKSIVTNATNGSYINNLVYADTPNDMFLEFDFKHRYEDENQRKTIFGDRTISDARRYYYDTIKHKSFLLSEMKLASSRKIGDIARAADAYDEFNDTHTMFNVITHNTHDFVPWLGQNYSQYNQYCSKLTNDVKKEDLKITDFYTIVPDNPTFDDLVKAYAPHKSFIKGIPKAYKPSSGCFNGCLMYNKYIKEGITPNNFNINVFLLGAFTRSEFEDMIYEFVSHIYQNYTNIDSFKSQCTIPNMIKVYQAWIKSHLEKNPTQKDDYASDKRWINALIKNPNANHIVVKLGPEPNANSWYFNKADLLFKP